MTSCTPSRTCRRGTPPCSWGCRDAYSVLKAHNDGQHLFCILKLNYPWKNTLHTMRDIDIWSTPLRLLYDHEDQHHYWPQDFWTPEHQQDCRSWGWASDYQMPSLVLLIQEFRGQNILMSLLYFLRSWIDGYLSRIYWSLILKMMLSNKSSSTYFPVTKVFNNFASGFWFRFR